MSIQYPIPLPFPVALDQEPMRACPRPARSVVADLSQVEDPSRPIGEFVAVWNGAVLGVKHFTAKADRRSFRVGENPDCDLWLPLEQLRGHDDVRLIRVAGERIAVTVLPGATGEVRRADGTRTALADLVRDGRTVPSAQIEGGHEVTLEAGERMHQDFGEFSFLANMVARPKLKLTRRREFRTAGFLAASLALHVGFLAFAWQAQADREGLAIDTASMHGQASMSMLGSSVFAIGDTQKLKEALSRMAEVIVCKVDTIGPRIVWAVPDSSLVKSE